MSEKGNHLIHLKNGSVSYRSWQDGIVLFAHRSADTLFLDATAGRVLEMLAAEELSREELIARLRDRAGEDRHIVITYVDEIVTRLRLLGALKEVP